MKRLMTVACALLVATATLAAPGERTRKSRMGVPMDRNLFPPELILRNQLALGLNQDQVDAVKKLVGETQSRVLDVQTDLHRATEQLRAALDNTKVDEAAALALASQAMDLEKRVKTAHLTLMIHVKNLLTEEQQDRARALMPERRQGPPDEIRD